MPRNKYILITSARNEEQLIENTIKSLVAQTIKPYKWIIVSDNSTDRTDEIVNKYAIEYPFIKLIRKEEDKTRNFASKVFALNLALSKIKNDDYDFIGILDADITFERDYYEKIFFEFEKDDTLGLAGGEFFDIVDGKKIRVIKSKMSVRGGIQLFRKACFDQIGEFIPTKIGGEDLVTEVTARKNGWKVLSFDHVMLEHHRLTGTGGWSIWKSKFNDGLQGYYFGSHPLFHIAKAIYKFKEKPYVFGGLLIIFGYFWGYFLRPKRNVSKEFIKFRRDEQIARMRSFNL